MVGRHKKPRTISIEPASLPCQRFVPTTPQTHSDVGPIQLLPDEVNAFLLRDHQGKSLQACADSLGISKTVCVGIYQSAKKKLALMILTGRPLEIYCPQNDLINT